MKFSFFHTAKNRQFTYKPLYYRPELDEPAARNASVRGAHEHRRGAWNRHESGGGRSDHAPDAGGEMSGLPRSGIRFRREAARQEAQQSNRRLLLIIFVILSLLILLFGDLKKLLYLLPLFVPLLWWTFRRALKAKEKSLRHHPNRGFDSVNRKKSMAGNTETNGLGVRKAEVKADDAPFTRRAEETGDETGEMP